MEKKRYCRIEFCENYHGTTDSRVHFFLLPTAGEYRVKWIERIMSHQEFDGVGQPKYLICDRHFEQRNLKCKEDRVALRFGTVPTIFPKPIIHVEHPPTSALEVAALDSDPLENITTIANQTIEDVPYDELDDPMDPLKNERCDEVISRGFKPIRLIRNPPNENLVAQMEPLKITKKTVKWLNRNPQNDDSNTPMKPMENEQSNQSTESTAGECKRCHELAVELSLTTIKIYDAEKKLKENDKMIKRKTQNLRCSNIELKHNNALANDLYANDSNEEPGEDEEDKNTKETKKAKTVKRFQRMGRHLPYTERKKFHEDMLTSFNQMSDSSALQAMMDIQSFIRMCGNSSEANK